MDQVLKFVGECGACEVAVNVEGTGVDINDFARDGWGLVVGIDITDECYARDGTVEYVEHEDEYAGIGIDIRGIAKEVGDSFVNAAFGMACGGLIKCMGEGFNARLCHARGVPHVVFYKNVTVAAHIATGCCGVVFSAANELKTVCGQRERIADAEWCGGGYFGCGR